MQFARLRIGTYLPALGTHPVALALALALCAIACLLSRKRENHIEFIASA